MAIGDVRFKVPHGHQDGTGTVQGDHPGRRKQKKHEGEKKGGRGRVRGGLKVTSLETMFMGKGKRPGTPSVGSNQMHFLVPTCGHILLSSILRLVMPRLPYQSLSRHIPVSLCFKLDCLQSVSQTYQTHT